MCLPMTLHNARHHSMHHTQSRVQPHMRHTQSRVPCAATSTKHRAGCSHKHRTQSSVPSAATIRATRLWRGRVPAASLQNSCSVRLLMNGHQSGSAHAAQARRPLDAAQMVPMQRRQCPHNAGTAPMWCTDGAGTGSTWLQGDAPPHSCIAMRIRCLCNPIHFACPGYASPSLTHLLALPFPWL